MALENDVTTHKAPVTRMAGKSGEAAGLDTRDRPHLLEGGAVPALGD